MRKSIIPGVSLRENEALSMTPVSDDSWEFTLTVYTKQLGMLRTRYVIADLLGANYPDRALEYMMVMMRSRIKQDVLKQVLDTPQVRAA